jgi:hypothetical protein
MPSKYSHSVVLAQQSSRGLINLSNDQYLDYLRSSPLLTTTPPPQRPSTALPETRQWAAFTRTDGSDRLAVRNSPRQQTSLDQLAAGAYDHASNGKRPGTARHVIILDSEEEDSGEDSDVESQSSRPSQAAYSTTSHTTNLRQKRLPDRLTIDLHQKLPQDSLLLPKSQNTQRLQQRTSQLAVNREPDVRQSIDLPIQRPCYSSASPARNRISAVPVHNRDVSNPKSLNTPQLSPTSTEVTHQEDSPATPFSSLQKGSTPALTDEQKPDLSRDDSAVSQNTRIYRPGPTKMPSQADFDGFFDDSEQGLGYFKNPPESVDDKKARLLNMRAYNAMEKALDDSPRKLAFDSDKTLPAVPDGDSDLHPPSQDRYRVRLDSFSSLSSLSGFAIGVPSVTQTTGHPKTSAAAMKTTTPSAVYELDTSTQRKQKQPSASVKPTASTHHFTAIPAFPGSQQPPGFDPTLLDPTTTTLTQFLSGIESSFSEPEPVGGAAAPPPDIARHPPMTLDPLAQLIIDSRGGVTSLQTQEKQRKRSKTGIFSSLRFKGKN